MNRIDALDIFRLQKPGFCLSGVYDIKSDDFLDHVKNPQGFPIDRRRYNNSWVYDNQTEGDPPSGWSNPNSIKIHIGNGGRGNRICPRWIDQFPTVTTETDSPYMILLNSQWDYKPMSVSGTRYILNAPTMRDWGGDVQSVLTYRLDYYWGGKLQGSAISYPNLEQYSYAPPWGLVRWQHCILRNGGYIPDTPAATSNKLQTVKDWQRTFPRLTDFGLKLPFAR